MTSNVKNIVIVGGGTAGWITAGTLAASLKKKVSSGYSITLIESARVPIVGVGEGTWPTMRNTLKNMGIKETDFIRQCHVSFKQGAKFCKWVTGKDDDFYYHPLILPQGHNQIDLTPHWLASNSQQSFAQSVCPQEAICELGLAPKHITTAEYLAQANYAYHLDAGSFSEFLKNHCKSQLDVKHIVDDVCQINSLDNGDIASVTTKENGLISGDLFIDCTGFNALLLGKHFKVPFISCEDSLFANQAIAVQVPYKQEDSPIQSHTLSTAQSAGWIWDIGLSTRRGVGSVYSNNHISEDQAHQELLNYLKPTVAEPEKLTFRSIPIKAGHRQRFWEKNCVAIGLSAGFLEPLEASAILLIEISAQMIADQLPTNRFAMDILAKRYNETFTYRWQRIIDFLKLHYTLTKRTDSQFWLDHQNTDTVSERLQEQLELWKYQFPCDNDFEQSLEIFPAASYQYVLYGMGFKTEPNPLGMSAQSIEMAQQHFQKNLMQSNALTSSLTSNRELLNKIQRYGLQTV
ncbi:tryptophan halogenase family protein [Colwellia echini]|uniref:Tryptophan 7-halogenase n=1 Tax=Colwellia echini TaxID=1982103 RepID=A0ABY3N175_9GAMM|nr:tryptophan halogenase family protein [Colwellia echini]TYK67220.1 tryptophan 7-halogenase [Colwellia echini]